MPPSCSLVSMKVRISHDPAIAVAEGHGRILRLAPSPLLK